jgi:hypothetical protein
MYNITFVDSEHGEINENFETWDEAAEYWQAYADAPTCKRGWLTDLDTHEIIWRFNESDE